MSKLDRADIQAQTDTLFGDNTSGDITESDFRTQFDDLSDSSVSLIDDYYPRVVGTPTGTVDAIVVSTDYPDAYDANIPIWFKATGNNTGAVTLKVNSLAALTLYAVNQTAITVADTLVSGRWYCAVWDTDADGSGTDGMVVIQSSGVIGSGFSGATGAFDTITDQAGTGSPDFSQGINITKALDTVTFTSSDAITAGNTSTTGNGYYVDCGSFVIVHGEINNINTSGMTGANNFWIQGFPFSAKVSTGISAFTGTVRLNTWQFGTSGSVGNTQTDPVLVIRDGESSARVQVSTDNTTVSSLNINDIVSTTSDIVFDITYFK